MPKYDYRCKEHGEFEKIQKVKEHARAECPTCDTPCSQILTSPPVLDVQSMARAGFTHAYTKEGDRITARHRSEDQIHRGGT